MNHDASTSTALVALAVSFGVGAILLISFMLWDLARLREKERIEKQVEEAWKPAIAHALGCEFVPILGAALSLDLKGIAIEVSSPRSGRFEIRGTCPDRDLVVKSGRNGEISISGSGCEGIDHAKRGELEAFVRDGGSIAFGRSTICADGVEATVAAARRIATLTRTLPASGKLGVASILRRVTSAEDPGRLSFSQVPEHVGQLSAPAIDGSLSVRNPLRASTRIWAVSGAGEDRVLAIPHDGRIVLVVADGAGGTGGGASAAETILARVQQVAAALCSGAATAVTILEELDRTLEPTGGQAAAVVAVASATGVHGASAGDVEAILLTKGTTVDLTSGRRRKPLLGSGSVAPVPFSADVSGRLLVGTDGLFGYAKRDAILEALGSGAVEDVPDRLIRLVRLPSGALQDDVGIVLCDLD